MNLPTLKMFSFDDKEDTTTTSGFSGKLVHFYSAFDADEKEIIELREYENGTLVKTSKSDSAENNNVHVGFAENFGANRNVITNATFDLGGNNFLYFDPQGDWDGNDNNDTRKLTLLDILNSTTTTNPEYETDVLDNQYIKERYADTDFCNISIKSLSYEELKDLYDENEYIRKIINDNAGYDGDKIDEVGRKLYAKRMHIDNEEEFEDIKSDILKQEMANSNLNFNLYYDETHSTYMFETDMDIQTPVTKNNYFINGGTGLKAYDNTGAEIANTKLDTLFSDAFWEYDPETNVFTYNTDIKYSDK